MGGCAARASCSASDIGSDGIVGSTCVGQIVGGVPSGGGCKSVAYAVRCAMGNAIAVRISSLAYPFLIVADSFIGIWLMMPD